MNNKFDYKILFLAILVIIFSISLCINHNMNYIALNKDTKFEINDEKKINNTNIKIKLVKIDNQLCNEMCIWQGEMSYNFLVTINNKTKIYTVSSELNKSVKINKNYSLNFVYYKDFDSVIVKIISNK